MIAAGVCKGSGFNPEWKKLEADMAKKEIKLVKMTRTLQEGETGPTKANVHPDEVENMKSGNWQEVE